MLLHALYVRTIVYGALESVAVLWRPRSHRDIIIIICVQTQSGLSPNSVTLGVGCLQYATPGLNARCRSSTWLLDVVETRNTMLIHDIKRTTQTYAPSCYRHVMRKTAEHTWRRLILPIVGTLATINAVQPRLHECFLHVNEGRLVCLRYSFCVFFCVFYSLNEDQIICRLSVFSLARCIGLVDSVTVFCNITLYSISL